MGQGWTWGERSGPLFWGEPSVVFASAERVPFCQHGHCQAHPDLLHSCSSSQPGFPRRRLGSQIVWFATCICLMPQAVGLQPEPVLFPCTACLGKMKPGSIFREWSIRIFFGRLQETTSALGLYSSLGNECFLMVLVLNIQWDYG